MVVGIGAVSYGMVYDTIVHRYTTSCIYSGAADDRDLCDMARVVCVPSIRAALPTRQTKSSLWDERGAKKKVSSVLGDMLGRDAELFLQSAGRSGELTGAPVQLLSACCVCAVHKYLTGKIVPSRRGVHVVIKPPTPP